MKKVSIVLTSVLLALIIAAIAPVHAFASSDTGSSGRYISEVKVGYAKNSGDAKAALDGYTILKDKNGNDVDINQNAGGGKKTKGDMCVYLGYKTTDDAKDGITDLAVMNMKGGYSVKDYESLMDTQMKSQIIPFVDNFKTAIEEYRVNYNSDNPLNKAKAEYAHDCLNKLTDDDTGKKLGDLLLSKTKYEMGDDEYNALSDTEKKEHADILTIIAQASGKATLMMENLITRACDTSEDTWIDRMVQLTYDDMVADTGLSPSKGKQELDKKYYDDATSILDMWDSFSKTLASYDDAKAFVDSYDQDAYDKAVADMETINDNMSTEEANRITEEYNKASEDYAEFLSDVKIICVHDHLESIPYEDGTLLDFFSQEQDDPTAVYPFIASLSDGQRAGLDFVSINDLVTGAMTNEEGYASADIEGTEETSIYENVDRGIYEPGGVALTSDAIRNDHSDVGVEYENGGLSGLTIAAWVITGASLVGAIVSAYNANAYLTIVNNSTWSIEQSSNVLRQLDLQNAPHDAFYNRVSQELMPVRQHALYRRMAIGCSVAMIIFTGISVYLTWRDLTKKYDIEFSPAPKYIVDEKDITAYNEKGEKIVVKNQSAYYKVVETNRNEGDDWYDVLGTANDLGGGVGKQWLALYSVKNEAEDPILTSSLLAVVSDDNIPAGYETGIHMFGTSASCNLNNPLYVFNDDAPSVYVYFQRDAGAKDNAEGSLFTGGLYALAAAGGIVLGALGAVLVTKLKKKKKETQE